MNMTKENHESIKKLKELRLANSNKRIKCYCVKKYINDIKLYEIFNISKKKVFYELNSELVTIGTFPVGLDIHTIDFVSENKEEALAYISDYMKKLN